MALAETHTTTPVIEHPAATAARLRAKCEHAVDQLLAVLDAIDAPADDLEDGGDDESEPAEHEFTGLGDRHNQMRLDIGEEGDGDCDAEPSLSAGIPGSWTDQRQWAEGSRDDREKCDSDCREPSGDDEHTLGATEGPTGSAGWVHGAQDGTEPSLAAPEGMNQRRWAHPNLAGNDLEEACEDEGAQCDDEGHDSDREPDHLDESCNWPDEGDQTEIRIGC